MDNVTFTDFPNPDGTTTTFAIIAHADGSFTSMTKEAYEATLAANSAPTAQ